MKVNKNSVLNLIDPVRSIVICSHISPDGDNLGSLLGLGMSLEKLGKKVTFLELDEIPKSLRFLPGLERLTDYIDDPIELFIAVDADTERLGEAARFFEAADKTLMIDHHKTNAGLGTVNIIDPDKSSTCEMVYDLIVAMGWPMDEKIATALLTGIITDTGRFMYPSCTERTLSAAAALMHQGADKKNIMRHLFQSEALAAKNLENMILSQTRFYYDNKLAVNHVHTAELEEKGVEISEIDHLVNVYRDTDQVEISCFLKEKRPHLYKVSLRSKNFDVSKIAEAFGGGGHLLASGCEIEGSRAEVEKKLVTEIGQYEL